MDIGVKASCNWTQDGGVDITKVLLTNITHEDVFIKPVLDDILGEDRAILLHHPVQQAAQIPCEFQIRVFPRYKIESLSMVCSVAKIELFIGQQREYTETVYGNVIEDDDEDSQDQAMNIHSYRYDIEISKSGVIEIVLKLITSAPEICIFGIVLNIAPNPNGTTTLLPNTINLENVEQMLNNSNSKLSPNAEKCKMFMQLYKSAQPPMGSTTSVCGGDGDGLLVMLEQMMSNKSANNPVSSAAPVTVASHAFKTETNDLVQNLKSYFDERLAALENKLLGQLAAHEVSQTYKLDRILMLLESKK